MPVISPIPRNAYERYDLPPDLLEEYSSRRWLLRPEEIVLNALSDQLPGYTMLDIGVGGGRTTFHFAHRVARYVGIDFNAGMIEACRSNFPHLSENLMLCDARSMGAFPDGSFDFVLFSFNGLDYLSPPDRLTALREIRRVGKAGAPFLFSSHNLNGNDGFRFRSILSKDPRKLIAGAWEFVVFTLMTGRPRTLTSHEFAVIYDGLGLYHRKLAWVLLSLRERVGYNYYIRPRAQVEQLRDLGFRDIQLFTQDGRQIVDEADMAAERDWMIHYYCRV